MCAALFQNFASLMKTVEKLVTKKFVLAKGQGARVELRRKSWLKQLRVAISTKASMPRELSPQNSRTNFVDLSEIQSFKEFL
jgi:hypothetical protein